MLCWHSGMYVFEVSFSSDCDVLNTEECFNNEFKCGLYIFPIQKYVFF